MNSGIFLACNLTENPILCQYRPRTQDIRVPCPSISKPSKPPEQAHNPHQKGLARERTPQEEDTRQPHTAPAPHHQRHRYPPQGRCCRQEPRRGLRHQKGGSPRPCGGGAGDAPGSGPGPHPGPQGRPHAGSRRCRHCRAHRRSRLQAGHRPGAVAGDRIDEPRGRARSRAGDRLLGCRLIRRGEAGLSRIGLASDRLETGIVRNIFSLSRQPLS